MDKLTTLKLKYPDGTYSDPILITVLAQNVKYDETNSLIDILNRLNARMDNIIVPDNSISENKLTSGLRATINSIPAMVGSPLTANSVNQLSDHDKIYVWTGATTASYTQGHWYYWKGSAWTHGGTYNSEGVEIDKTLSIEGMAADANTVGEAFWSLNDRLKFNHKTINYGYSPSKMLTLDQQPSGTAAKKLGVKRQGTIITLNMSSTSQNLIRVHLSGTLVRTTLPATVQTWEGISSLTPGSLYEVSLKKLSGFSTGSDPTPGIVVYTQGTSSTSLGDSFRDEKQSYYRIFTAPSQSIIIVLYVYEGMTFTDAKYEILLRELTSEDVAGPFERLAYLESSGKEKVTAGIKANQNTRVVCDFQFTNPGTGATQYLFGARTNTSENIFTFGTSQSDRFTVGYNNSAQSTDCFADQRLHTVDYNKNNVYLDGTLIYSTAITTFESGYNIHLFAIRGGASSYYFGSFKIYRCKIYNGNNLICDFFPVIKKSNGARGLYNSIDGSFHEKTGAGNFFLGQPVQTNEEVESVQHHQDMIGEINDDIYSIKLTGVAPRDYVSKQGNRVADKVRAVQIPNTTLSMIAVSDLHYKDGNKEIIFGLQDMAQGVRDIKNQAYIDYMVSGGDLNWRLDSDKNYETGKKETAEATKLISEVFQGYPQIRLVGNHDVNRDGTNNFSLLDRYNLIGTYSTWTPNPDQITHGYGYIDDEKYKVRFICLNTTETSTSYGITAAQLRWWVNKMDLTEKNTSNNPNEASNWKIIMMSHVSMDSGQSPSTEAPFRQHMKIVEAYIAGSTGNYTANLGSATATINYDFSGKNAAKLILWIHGHSHNYKINNMYNTNSQFLQVPRLTLPNALPDREGDDFEIKWTKTPNSTESTAFVVNTINFNSKIVYSHHYGAGYDRILHYEPQTLNGSTTLSSQFTNVTWESLNPSVATVSNGVVTSVASGSAMIRAKASNGDSEFWNILV